jgi:hypothetical protein
LASLSQECFATGRGIAAKYLILTELKRCFHHRGTEAQGKLNEALPLCVSVPLR